MILDKSTINRYKTALILIFSINSNAVNLEVVDISKSKVLKKAIDAYNDQIINFEDYSCTFNKTTLNIKTVFKIRISCSNRKNNDEFAAEGLCNLNDTIDNVIAANLFISNKKTLDRYSIKAICD